MKRLRLFCFLFIAVSLVSLPVMPGLSSGRSLTSKAPAKTLSAASTSAQPEAIYHSPAVQQQPSRAEALVQRAMDDVSLYVSTQDDDARKSAKKNLEQAEKYLKEEINSTPNCERCHELFVATYYYRAQLRIDKDFDQCVKVGEQAAARFPDNWFIAAYRGYAYYNRGEYAKANKMFNVALRAADHQSAAQISQVLQDSQQRFLTSWNRQADFYYSKESRIDIYNPQAYQWQTVFQVTPEIELQLGAQGFAAMASQAAVLIDPEIQTYLENLIARLVSNTPGSPFNYRVTVLNSPVVNAATPPGHVIVYTGMLQFVDNEAQLAGVLAHELAHNYGHHSARTLIKEYLARNTANTVLRAINPQNQWAQLLGNLGANIGLTLFSRAYSRFEEKEADLYGAHIMYNAGYSPMDASSFFLKLSKTNQKQPPKFLRTHPLNLDRAEYLMEYLEGFPVDREFQTDSEEFRRIKARLTSSLPPPM